MSGDSHRAWARRMLADPAVTDSEAREALEYVAATGEVPSAMLQAYVGRVVWAAVRAEAMRCRLYVRDVPEEVEP